MVAVNVQVAGTYEGTTTEADGTFAFVSEQRGPQRLIVNFFGYKDIEVEVEVGQVDSLLVEVAFKKQTISLEEVTVSDVRRVETTDRAKATVLNTVDILTTAVDGNVQSAVQTLSGVQPQGESSGLFIRGGSGNESQAFVDGMLVDDFNYGSPANTNGSSRFSPNMFKGTFLSTGGFSAKYGQAISGALILETTDIASRSSADLGISPLFVQGGFDRVNTNGTASYGAAATYQNLGLFLRMMPSRLNFTEHPVTAETTGHFKWKPREDALLKVYGSYGMTGMSIYENSLDVAGQQDHTTLNNRNVFTQATYRQDLSPRWTLESGVGYGRRMTDTRLGALVPEDGQWTNRQDIWEANVLGQARAGLSYRRGRSTFEVGGETQLRDDEVMVNDRATGIADTYSAAYAEGSRHLVGALYGRAGLRLEHSTLLDQVLLSPRASLSYLLSKKDQFFLSYGRFAQRPRTRYLYDGRASYDFQRADHYIFGFHRTSNKRTLRAEAYHKQYADLLRLGAEPDNSGFGHARGLELMFQDRQTIKGVDYRLTYSYVDAERDYLDFPTSAQPTFVANHVFNASAKKFFPKALLNVGMTYTYASGRPFYNPNHGDFLGDRTPDYHNLNLNIAYLPKIGKTFSVIVLTLYNALDFEQTFSYQYGQTNPSARRRIGPMTDRYAFLGFFMNFGFDRTDDIIDRQLN